MSTAIIKNEPIPMVLRRLNSLMKIPFGKKLFTLAICTKSPYFASIKPKLIELRPGHSEWSMKKRRSVENHLGTVHALAMGNICELAAGTLMEVSLSTRKRWIPKDTHIEYLAKAKTDLRALANISYQEIDSNGDTHVIVNVMDLEGTTVVRAKINMWVSDKKAG